MTHKRAALLDTSFFLRFLNDEDPLFRNADGYFRYFLNSEIDMFISTISIGEYCVGGDVHELPLKNLQILPFNFMHAQQTGLFARIAFTAKRAGMLKLHERNIIPNDTKLFAQANCEKAIDFYLSSDTESFKIYNLLKAQAQTNFQFIDLNIPHTAYFGMLEF